FALAERQVLEHPGKVARAEIEDLLVAPIHCQSRRLGTAGADLAVAIDDQRYIARPFIEGQAAESARQIQVERALDVPPGPFAAGPDINEQRAKVVQALGLISVD